MTMLAVANNDLAMVNGSLVEVSGVEEVRQHLEMRLKLWRGELWYNTDDGVDYADLVFPARDQAEVLGELRKVAAATPGVTDVVLVLVSATPEKMVVAGTFIADLADLDDFIRSEFGPVTITGTGS